METSILMQLTREFQTLSGADGLAVFTLAILVRTLPTEQQKKALLYGIFGVFFFRVVALIFAAHLMSFVAFKIIGGGYLVYLAMKHMFFSTRRMPTSPGLRLLQISGRLFLYWNSRILPFPLTASPRPWQ